MSASISPATTTSALESLQKELISLQKESKELTTKKEELESKIKECALKNLPVPKEMQTSLDAIKANQTIVEDQIKDTNNAMVRIMNQVLPSNSYFGGYHD